jgi:DNA polymerase
MAMGEMPNDYLSPAAQDHDCLRTYRAVEDTHLAQYTAQCETERLGFRGASASALIATPAQAAPLTPDSAVMLAREAARSAATLEDLRAILEGFNGCALKATATKLVFADGNPKARVMFVGEAPGYEEDRSGLPFVGRSGKLLDLMLTAIRLDRTSVYIANIVPWRPPEIARRRRRKRPSACHSCCAKSNCVIPTCWSAWADRRRGRSSASRRNSEDAWALVHFNNGKREIRAMPTLHPAYLLRSPIAKRLAWRDFLAIKKALATTASA